MVRSIVFTSRFTAAPDPPEVLEGDSIDLAAYLYEYLALAIDPFPRKPGAVFEYKSPVQESSPFDVLSRLKGKAS